MKTIKNIYILLLCAVATVLTGCSDFLEVDVKGKATIPTFLSDPQGLRAALVGTYNKMYLYVDNEFTKYGDAAGNMVTFPSAASSGDMIAQYNFTSDESQVTGAVGYIWRKIYVAQANANNIIEYAPAVIKNYPTYADRCNNIMGQALLIRAMCHFDQCRAYAQP
ncbi:MAG: RagB/SusD family nutrient uptake outer membrane protein, partial [Prevotella sp.]|nr:RagB/SusD family nutrient uptake outer membrane protein [Prevotella sp.]